MDIDLLKPIVIALGGNAISKGSGETIAEQFFRARTSLIPIVDLAKSGYRLAITHGNGPQVGNALLRVELSREKVISLPLFMCGGSTQGEIGFVIVNTLNNLFNELDVDRNVAVIVTQVEVDREDKAFGEPTKYVGMFYSEDEAKSLARSMGWIVKEDSGRGWRRVVASPWPKRIIEVDTISSLLDSGVIVVCVGGGGIPIYKDESGKFHGVDAVIDKDRASALLALEIGAEVLVILTSVEKVSTEFNTLYQKDWDVMSVGAAKNLLASGEFPKGSMGPKIQSAIYFIENGGKEVIITSIDKVKEALENDAGTRIIA
ncbi:carbamate kinase [bacterium]|nr:carbamate kinase [bacterium]